MSGTIGDYRITTTVTKAGGSVVTEVIQLTTISTRGTTNTLTATSTLIGGAAPGTGRVVSSGTLVASGSSSSYYVSSSSSSPHKPSSKASSISQSGVSLSMGAKAGIGVGIGVAVVVLTVLVLLLRKRQHRKDRGRETSGEQLHTSEKATAAPGESSAKDRVLPTWKSELSGESHRAELDAPSDWTAAASKVESAPVEMDAAGFHSVERTEVAADEPQTQFMPTWHGEEIVDSSNPPPIPYESKPKPTPT